MLLLIFLGLISVLAIAQGLLLLFLIRTRGHALSQTAEILKLQSAVGKLYRERIEQASLDERLKGLERLFEEELKEEESQTGKEAASIIRLAAVGGCSR